MINVVSNKRYYVENFTEDIIDAPIGAHKGVKPESRSNVQMKTQPSSTSPIAASTLVLLGPI